MSSYTIETCELSSCTAECKQKERIQKGWVVFIGRIWAFKQSQSRHADVSFCSWEHFKTYVEDGNMKS